MSYDVWYRVPECCDESLYKTNVAWHPMSENEVIKEAIAGACARDYNDNHEGYESSWPLTFNVHSSGDGPMLFSASVGMEMVARYSARLIPST